MQASVGKIEPGMDEEEMETLMLEVKTAVRGVGKTVNGETKYSTRVQRFNDPVPEDWSYPTDWKKQDCHYFCHPPQEDEQWWCCDEWGRGRGGWGGGGGSEGKDWGILFQFIKSHSFVLHYFKKLEANYTDCLHSQSFQPCIITVWSLAISSWSIVFPQPQILLVKQKCGIWLR